jgi:hypothetical protein
MITESQERSLELALVRSLRSVHKVAQEIEYLELEVSLYGQVDSETGMILNLVHFDDVIKSLAEYLAQGDFPTVRDSLLGGYLELKRLLTPYFYDRLRLSFFQPQFGMRYFYGGQEIHIEIEKFMRYQNQFGLARVAFQFDHFAQLPDRERRQNYWSLGVAESPSLALKGKFPYAYLWEFKDFLSQEIYRLERSLV